MVLKAILAIMAVVALSTAGVGFGKQLTTGTPEAIAGKQLVDVGTASATVGAVTWSEGVDTSGNIIVSTVTVPVTNSDAGASHTFNVCGVLKGSDSTVTTAVCQSSGSIAASGNTNVSLSFASQNFSVEKLDKISISAKQTA